KLIEGARAGQPRELSRLSSRFQKMIIVNCILQLDDERLAEDAAQEVSEKMLGGISALQSPAAFTAWLQRIIINTCTSYNRRTQTRHLLELHLDAPGEQALLGQLVERRPEIQPESYAEQRDLHEQLSAAIHRLPGAQRRMLVLFYYGELTYREIAEVENVKIGTVSSTLSKAKKNLLVILGARPKTA
ncbi:MAG: sigma-70 family RNA polymerase sigma factor, partial [Coriobacteriia bacterium]|nr:sigma-70 family RNA polymerase sigma factor [Coriobacteriia bacterium]